MSFKTQKKQSVPAFLAKSIVHVSFKLDNSLKLE